MLPIFAEIRHLLVIHLCYTHVNFDVSELLPEHSGHVQNTVLIVAVLNAIKVVQRQIGRTLKLLTFKHQNEFSYF